MSFSFRLTELKTHKKLTNTELAAIMGVTEGSVRNYLLGNSSPDIEALSKLSASTGIDLNWLIKGDATQLDDVAKEDMLLYEKKKSIAGVGREYAELIQEEMETIHKRLSSIEKLLRASSNA